jgi:DNA-binding CsgD family transcriptional regulator
MNTKKDYSILRQPISPNNLSQISELIVLRAIKTRCEYDHQFDKLYKGLLCDMFDKNKRNFSFSDAYDLVQDVNIFLLDYEGRYVDEILYFNKKGLPITICKACYKIVDRYAWMKTRDSKTYCLLDESIEYDTIPKPDYDTEQSYNTVESLISAMKLSETEEETLRLLYNGVGAYEIAKRLSLCFQTVYQRRNKIQNKYLKLNEKI